MDTFLNIVLGILALIVLVWVAIFGGIGALLSRSRTGSAVAGLAWGTLLGPIGWVVIWWRTRSARRGVQSGEWLGDAVGPSPAMPVIDQPRREEGTTGGHRF